MSGNILRMRYVLFKFKVFCLKKSYSGTKCIKRTHIEKDKDYQDDGLLLRKNSSIHLYTTIVGLY